MAFVVALMRDHLLLNQDVGFGNQRGGALRVGIVEGIHDRPQPVEATEQREMIMMQLAARRGGHAPAAANTRRPERAQRIEDHGNVDQFLKDGGRHRQQPAERPPPA